jgi:ABC-type antimicrobial peptide transport system permease subunit
MALSLASVGLFCVVSYTVVQRTNELGIRMALGAQRGHVLRIVFATTAVSIGTGVLTAVLVGLAMNTLLATLIDGNVRDPVLLPVGAVLRTLVAAIACFLPARRACHIDPMAALRCE